MTLYSKGGKTEITNIQTTCQKEAKKYQARSKFERGSSGAYEAARTNGWLDGICKHMPKIAKHKATPLKHKN